MRITDFCKKYRNEMGEKQWKEGHENDWGIVFAVESIEAALAQHRLGLERARDRFDGSGEWAAAHGRMLIAIAAPLPKSEREGA